MPISRIKSNSLDKNIELQGEAVRFPIGTQANRPSPAKKGDLRYNSDVDKTEISVSYTHLTLPTTPYV